MKAGPVFLLFHLIAISFALGQDAGTILEKSGITGGLVVHLGCGEGKLAVDLAAENESLLVHGIDSDAGAVAAARKLFQGQPGKLATRLSADLREGEGTLPCAENLVNLLVLDRGDSLGEAEMRRILTPGGKAFRLDTMEVLFSKPAGSKKAEWTHYQYDASNNMVGEDPDCGVPRRFQWSGTPLWSTSHENMSSLNAMVSANGRVFYIIDEGPRASVQLPADWQLVARDAYNGVVLWKKPLEQWLTRFWPWKSGPAQMPRKLVAVGDRVYAPLDINGELVQFDAATGRELQVYEGTAAAEEFIHTVDGILLVQVNPDPSNQAEVEEMRRKRRHFSYDGRNRATIDHDKEKRIVAIEAETGKRLWEQLGPRVSALSLGALGDNVVWHNGDVLVCHDLKTGKRKWVSDPYPLPLKLVSEESPTVVLHPRAVYVAMNRKMTAFSMEDGKTLWSSDWPVPDYRSPVSLILMQDLVWSMNIMSARAPGTFTGRDPLTGEIRKQFDLPPFKGIGHHRCYKAKASGDFVLLSRSGVEYVDPSKESYQEHHWIRGGCLYGILPANGMLYSTPHACACYIKGKLNGFTAMTPGPTAPADPPDPAGSPSQKGSGFYPAAADESLNRESDWPTYRGNVERSGRSSIPVNPELKLTWKTDLGGDLTAVTVGGGKVFVCQKERNTVHAIDAGSGARSWRFTAGAQVDSPPTFDAGRVYFGSADGSVYCLRAADGELSWRTRVVPRDRRVVAFGRVESAWPVHGSVLVQDGAVFASAGRSSFLDGGIAMVKIDAETGRILGSHTVYDFDSEGKQPPLTSSFDMEGALSDILSGDGEQVYMRHLGFEKETLSPGEPAPHAFSPTGYLDDNWWHRTYWVYGDDTKGGYGGWWQAGNKLPAGRLLVHDDDTVFAFGRSFYAGMNSAQFGRGEQYILYASGKEAGEDPDYGIANQQRRRGGDLSVDWEKFRTTPIRWKDQVSFHVRAMVLAGDTLFAAGPYGDAVRSMESFSGERGNRLAAFSVKDGSALSAFAIDSLPVFDGLAAAGGNLYLSTKDGSVQCFGEAGEVLTSTLGEPVENLPEELLPSDEDYRKETQEFLGKQSGGGKKGPRKELKGKSRAASFDLLENGKVVEAPIGYRLGAGDGKVALALRKLEAPVTKSATWRFRMQAAKGFGQPDFYQNGFLVFGDGAGEAQLVKCGLQFIQETAVIFEGSPPGKGVREKLQGDPSRLIELEVSVDLEEQTVVLRAGGQSVTRKLNRKLGSVSHVGYATWNAVTDFSELE